VTELREHRERLAASVDEAEAELAGLMRDAGDGAGQDQADVGATSFERDHELTVLARERETLEQIERALSHIDDGSYGVCDSCGNPVGKNRLMAVPHATLCMSCKQREERR
jgi:RNA polymerase-binding protein DksA